MSVDIGDHLQWPVESVKELLKHLVLRQSLFLESSNNSRNTEKLQKDVDIGSLDIEKA